MGFRMRKSFKVIPGVRMTVSTRGISTSVGTKGDRVTRSSNGRVTRTMSIPGTGMSHTKTAGGSRPSSSSTSRRQPPSSASRTAAPSSVTGLLVACRRYSAAVLECDGFGGSFPFPPARSESMMSRSKSRPVVLSPAEREKLRRLVRTGSHPAQQVRRARILLELDQSDPTRPGLVATQVVIAERVGVSVDLVQKTSRAYAERGADVEATITRKKRQTPPVEPKVTGEVEARLTALACSQPPEGHARWSLRLLEKHVVLIDDIPDLDHSTIGRVLKKGRFVLI
jgi:hypothetical protein